MKSRKLALLAALSLISLPVLVAMVEYVSFDVANRPTGSIRSSGLIRDYVLHVPDSYDASRAVPLVISLHGAGLWGAAQKEISQWNRLADEHGFIVVYPSGMKGGGPRIWHVEASPLLAQDIRFIAELIDTLATHYNIDAARVYANGISNGGGMSFVLSCTLSDRIAAVGMVAAAQTLPWSWCKDGRPVPMIAFHGTDDRTVPYRGGGSWRGHHAFPDVATWTANWARRNGCSTSGSSDDVATDVTRIQYASCTSNAAVVLYTIRGGGHTWPGGQPLPEWFTGRTTNGIDATSLMWAFFSEHPLPRK